MTRRNVGLFVGFNLEDTRSLCNLQHVLKYWRRGARARDFMLHEVGPLSAKHNFDRTKHFHRQRSMVRPAYQLQGLMRRLTAHINEIADTVGQPVYVSARSAGVGPFLKEGFEVLDWVDLEMGELDENFRGKGELENGKTRFRLMKREVGAKATPEKKLVEE